MGNSDTKQRSVSSSCQQHLIFVLDHKFPSLRHMRSLDDFSFIFFAMPWRARLCFSVIPHVVGKRAWNMAGSL